MDKTLRKLVLDIILTVLFVLLIYPRQTGFSFHELAGLASGALVLFHLLLNWSWVKNVSRNLFNPKVKAKTKYFYLLNALSLLVLVGIIITGIQISAVLFPSAGPASRSIITLHKWLSYGCLGLLGLHLALHWKFVAHTAPRLFRSAGRPSPGKVALNLGALVLTLGLLFTQSGFNPANYAVSPKPSPEAVYSTAPVAENPPSPAADTLPASVPVSNSRGQGRNKHSSTVTTTVPAPTISPSPSGTDTGSSLSPSPGTTSGTSSVAITLTQYLSNLYCTGCSKQCSLLSPQCSIGVSQAAAAQQKYTAIYGSASLN
ncbi:MAG: DUF4405 domain-containing protein [Syntrophomonadaceae bacterium]